MKTAPWIFGISVLWLGMYAYDGQGKTVIISTIFLCTFFIVHAIESRKKPHKTCRKENNPDSHP